MSLVTQDSLMVILIELGAEPAESNDCLTLAMPIEIIFYYESKLLNYVITTYEGLLMQSAIPLATRKTAKPVSMPQSSQNTALRWKLEQHFLAVFEDSMKEAALDRFLWQQNMDTFLVYQLCSVKLASMLSKYAIQKNICYPQTKRRKT